MMVVVVVAMGSLMGGCCGELFTLHIATTGRASSERASERRHTMEKNLNAATAGGRSVVVCA